MKIAVINHIVNRGGGARYDRALLLSIKKIRPDIEITYFVPLKRVKEENLYNELIDAGIRIEIYDYKIFKEKSFFRLKFLDKIYNNVRRLLKKKELSKCKDKINSHDLAFFTWPYFIECPDITCPIYFIPHDFNYRHFFGSYIYRKNYVNLLTEQHTKWLKKAKPIVSTNFMANELKKFYPQYKDEVKVVHVAPFSSLSRFTKEEAKEIIKKFGINYKYILYPCNTTYHKNLGVLLSATYLLNKREKDIKLIFVGYDTEEIKGKAHFYGIERRGNNYDVLGLGYVSNNEIDALIQCAEAVITTSLYEAGNGPGLDAWVKGTPVAMSNIPAFMEHLEVQNVRAQVFDPKNPHDIADKIQWILDNPEQAKEDALHSQREILKYNWEATAQKYVEIFEEAVKI